MALYNTFPADLGSQHLSTPALSASSSNHGRMIPIVAPVYPPHGSPLLGRQYLILVTV